MGQGALYIILLAVLAGLSSWFLFTLGSSLQKDTQQVAQLPTLYIDNYLATATNEQGIRNYTLNSPHAVQLPGKQGTQLEQPDIAVFQQDGETREWLIESESGWISHDNELVRMERAVTMIRPTSSGKTPVVITTRNLLVYPYKDYAETYEPARMVSPGIEVDSIGLKAWLEIEQLELLSDVRGNYEPAKP